MQKIITIKTTSREALYNITNQIHKIVNDSNIETGLVNIYAQGATAGIMIQEGWDESVPQDVINFLKKHIPQGIWQHDKQDNNGDAHLKSGLIGPSENIPIIDGKLGLSRWQNIFFCEFDGPRDKREIVITIL